MSNTQGDSGANAIAQQPTGNAGRGSHGRGGRSGGRSGRGRGRTQQSTYKAFTGAAKAGGDDDVPILKYGPGNNYVVFKEKLEAACVERYGNLGRIIRDENYWVPTSVDQDKSFPNWSTDEIEKALLIDAKKERHRLIAKMKLERPQLYAYIWMKMSKESVDELKRHENYDSFDNSKDPLELWKAVKELHMTTTGSKLEVII